MVAAVIAIAGVLAAVVIAQLGLIVALTAWYRAAIPNQARADVLQHKLDESLAANAELVKRLAAEVRRSDALDALLADAAVSGPVAGSYERLLQKWRTVRATSGDGGVAVPVAGSPRSAAATARDTDLLKPGE